MPILSLAAEPQNKEITYSSKSVQIRKSVYFLVIKNVNGYKSCLMVPKVLSFFFFEYSTLIEWYLKVAAQLKLKMLFWNSFSFKITN